MIPNLKNSPRRQTQPFLYEQRANGATHFTVKEKWTIARTARGPKLDADETNHESRRMRVRWKIRNQPKSKLKKESFG